MEHLMYVAPFKVHGRTFLVVQWLRIRLPMQGTRVRSLVWEDPTCRRATKPVHHNYWACGLEPMCHNYWARVPQLLSLHSREPTRHDCWARVPQLLSLHSRAHAPQLLSLRATTTEACAPRARAPQQKKPPQWEARAPQRRVALAWRN